MTPSQLLRAVAALIEEVAHKGYDEHGDEQPISAEQWEVLRERFSVMVLMNKPREAKSE